MSLRVPVEHGQTVQVEFHEIERRLRKLEKRTGIEAGGISRVTVLGSSGAGSVNLTPILARLDALEDALANLPDQDINVFGGVGAASSEGLVPAPGTSEPPTGVANHLLSETGEWDFPLRGLIGVATDGEDVSEGEDVVDVSAGLHVSGNLSASSMIVRHVYAFGYVIPQNGVMANCEDDLSVAGLI